MQTTITLYGRSWKIQEPVFFALKQIIERYNRLANPDLSTKQRANAIIEMIRLLVPDPCVIPTGWKRLLSPRLTEDEVLAFIKAVPALCGFDTIQRAEETSKDPWGELYAYLACNHGYTWHDIDHTMTLSRWNLINDYWLSHPPINVLKAAELGYDYQKPMSFLEYAEKSFGVH